MLVKHVTIACNEGGETCILKGAKGKRVVMISDIPGRTTLARLIIRDGDTSVGGGLAVSKSNVNLIMSSFVDNSADRGGAIYVGSDDSNTVTLQGCIFEGNTATTNGPDIYNEKYTGLISACPTGESPPPHEVHCKHPPTNPPPHPTGYPSTQGSKLDNYNDGGTMTDPAFSYTCAAPPTLPPSSAPSSAPSITLCPAGKFGSFEPNCTDCPAGKISDQPKSPSCTNCKAGHSSGEGQTSCDIDCPSGRYSTCGTKCELCEAGKFSPQFDATTSATCVDCAGGKYSTQRGASSDLSCMACPGAEPGSSTCDEEPEPEDEDKIELAYHIIEITCGLISLGGR